MLDAVCSPEPWWPPQWKLRAPYLRELAVGEAFPWRVREQVVELLCPVKLTQMNFIVKYDIVFFQK